MPHPAWQPPRGLPALRAQRRGSLAQIQSWLAVYRRNRDCEEVSVSTWLRVCGEGCEGAAEEGGERGEEADGCEGVEGFEE